MATEKNTAKDAPTVLEITLDCSNVISYYHLQNEINPIKRLYVKNLTADDMEKVKVRIFSKPEFLLSSELEQALLPRKATTKFDTGCRLSPLFIVALDKRIEGEICVEVLNNGNEVIAQAKRDVKVLAFNECNYNENLEALATFVKRTQEVNKLVALANKRLEEWRVPNKSAGYSLDKNGVRNFFAACYTVLLEKGFIKQEVKGDNELISTHKEMLESNILSPLELALLFSAMIEASGFNPILGTISDKWYVGCFLSAECFGSVVNDDASILRKKLETGVNDITLVPLSELFNGTGFEKAEKAAGNTLKKVENVDFFIDIKRARIMRVYPLPERVKSASGYDLVSSKEYIVENAPSQIKEYKGAIAGEKEISRVHQWERKLLEMDLSNSLVNFRVLQTTVKLLTPSLENFIENIPNNKVYSVEPRPTDGVSTLEKVSNGFDRANFLKPFTDHVLYEYKNKKLLTVFSGKDFDGTLTKLYRKEKSIQEETGTATLYLAAGFLKWCETPEGEPRYAPLFLYPVTISKKGVASTTYSIEINAEEVHLNSTVLEFVYQVFNLDMRGLQNVELTDSKAMLSIIARIKKEIVNFRGWEVLGDVFLASLSFTNYLMWHDVKYKADTFKQNKLIHSFINNCLDFPPEKMVMSNRCSDEAYSDTKEKLFLPISADSSQYSAIYDSLTKSFVLHGPPGTGKSQTITNIIANNIVRGRRVLFVAEKMAALSVVNRRLQSIGLGDFCLELHSDKTNKMSVLNQIIKTLSIGDGVSKAENLDKVSEIGAYIDKLQAELSAMHSKRYLGFSLYEAILDYFENQDAPDCLRIDSLFYEKLTETTFNNYLEVLTELALRAKECGDIEKSPFKRIGRFEYNIDWRKDADAVLDIYLLELKHLRQYARNLLPLFNMRTVSLTRVKLEALYLLASALQNEYIINYFSNFKTVSCAKGLIDSFKEAYKKSAVLQDEYSTKFGRYPDYVDLEEVQNSVNTGNISRVSKRYIPSSLDKSQRNVFLEFLLKCEQNNRTLSKRSDELKKLFNIKGGTSDVAKYALDVAQVYDSASKLYADFDINIFNECCAELTKNSPSRFLDYYKMAYEVCSKAKDAFSAVFCIEKDLPNEDISGTIEYVGNVQKNIDYIPNWCRYQEIVEKCRSKGFEFVLEPLSDGEITANDILRCFKKCVYNNFVRSELYLDDVLCQFSGLSMEDTANRFKTLTEEYERLTRAELYNRLCAALPRPEEAGDHNIERVIIMRNEKTNLKGTTLRNLFKEIPTILKATCPCMLMSPTSVTQFLDIDMEKFDLVIFDEASQIPTSKAIGSIVRGKDVVIVGDPKQLPPTTFFHTDYKDDEHYEVEDLESVLDDCLAIGMPESHLLWHYRSNHESLIAFSNAMFYDNTLLTFPSPNELNSKVSFKYVDGVYERGGSKCNKKEGDELINEVIERLSDPYLRAQSIGIVTFNTAQQTYIEDKLLKQIHAKGLDAVAFEREEPLFVKNLENVQGDERDVILFSVGYAPDQQGKLSLNFGPINQNGGYKRLNVAVTRARTEMKVFSGITGNMIDLSRTDSKGVKGLKAFLEYAERGREMLAIDSRNISGRVQGIGSLIAADLKDKGILCDYNLGVSNFKIDVAVVDPRNKDKYILAIICDGENSKKLKGVKDRTVMQNKILKKLGWNTYYLWTINYFNNPKREITKIRDVITALTEKKVISKKLVRDITAKYQKTYKPFYSKPLAKAGVDYVLNFVNEEAITSKIRAVIQAESPIDEETLLGKLLVLYNVPKTNKRAVSMLTDYMQGFASLRQELGGKVFYVDKPIDFYRPNDVKTARDLAKIHPNEIVAAAKCAIETKLNLTRQDIVKEVVGLFCGKKTKAASEWIELCVDDAIKEGQIMVTVDDLLAT